MNKYIQRENKDENHKECVEYLVKHGAYVLEDHNDILVYSNNSLKQIEIKSKSPFTKGGKLKISGKGSLQESQIKLLLHGNDNYGICWTPRMCLEFIAGKDGDYITPSKYMKNIQKWGAGKLSSKQKKEILFAKWAEGLSW